MPVPFKHIPAGNGLLNPLFFAEVDNSQANTATQAQRALIIGQQLSTGTLTPNVPVLSQGIQDAKNTAGYGSMIANMVWGYRQTDPTGELWVLPLADQGGAVKASGTITFTGPTTAVGVLALYVAGFQILTTLASGTSANAAATAVAAAINAVADCPVTAAAASAVVTLTAKNGGAAGNDIDIRTNYLGSAGGEATPAGLGVAIVAMASGATNPTLTTALANLAEMPFDFIISPYLDATSITALTALLNDTAGRWAWSVQVYGHCVIAYRGTSGALATFGGTVNDQHLTAMGFYDAPTLNYVWAAILYGAMAVSVRADPGVPLQYMPLPGIKAPPPGSSGRFLFSQRSVLLVDGISTFTVAQDGTVITERIITTYQTNTAGQPDNSYKSAETMFLLMYVIRQLKSVITSKYARCKLAADGTVLAPGAGVVTPAIIRADLIAQYKTMELDGFVQNSAAFAAGLIVEKDAANPNRVNVLWDGTLIDQLVDFAMLVQFKLI